MKKNDNDSFVNGHIGFPENRKYIWLSKMNERQANM